MKSRAIRAIKNPKTAAIPDKIDRKIHLMVLRKRIDRHATLQHHMNNKILAVYPFSFFCFLYFFNLTP